MAKTLKNSKQSAAHFYVIISVLVFIILFLVVKLTNTTVSTPVKAEDQPFILPSDAVKISECLPAMGTHWVEPSKIPFGPYYVLNNGKLVSLEYMFKLSDIPGEDFANLPPTMDAYNKYLKDHNMTWTDYFDKYKLSFDLPDMGKPVKSVSLQWSGPHAGFVVPHLDVHVSYVNTAAINNICPDANIMDSFAPALIQNLIKNHVAIPGM